jgi:hypothetical protein
LVKRRSFVVGRYRASNPYAEAANSAGSSKLAVSAVAMPCPSLSSDQENSATSAVGFGIDDVDSPKVYRVPQG